MNYRLLGNSGLRVSEFCLGTMSFGTEWGWGADRAESQRLFEVFAEAGGQFLDTANCYTNGTSERFLADFLATDRDHFIVGTKYSLSMRPDDPNACGNHRKSMITSLEGSLKRLHTDYIDVFWLHAWDKFTPIEETMRGLDDLVRMGKVLYVGISDTPAWVVSQANMLAQLRGWSPFIGLQIQYSLMERTPERDLLPMARALGLGVTAWRALGAGILVGKYNTPGGIDASASPRIAANDPRLSDGNFQIAETIRGVARAVGRSSAQVALNWLRQQPGTIIPILGIRNVSQLQNNLAALEFELSAEHLDVLSAATAVDLGFPRDFLESESFQRILYGTTRKKICV